MLKTLWKKDKFPQRLVYTHLAKTGGNTVTAFLNRISQEYAISSLGISGAAVVNACPEHLKRVIDQHRLPKKKLKIILGHLPFSASSKVFPFSLFTTTLRKPEWRVVSSYCSQPFNRNKPDFGMSEFIDMFEANPYAAWAIDNYQTRLLCDTPSFGEPSNEAMLESAKRNLKEHYFLVGFSERMEAYFQSLGAIYGYAAPKSIVPPQNVTGNYQPHVEPHHLEYVKQRDALDMALYQWARQEFSSLPSPSTITMPEEKRDSYMNIWINYS